MEDLYMALPEIQIRNMRGGSLCGFCVQLHIRILSVLTNAGWTF